MELSNQLPGSHPLTAPVLLPERVTGPPEVHPSEGPCPTGPTAVAPAESRGDRPLDKADRRLDSAGPRPGRPDGVPGAGDDWPGCGLLWRCSRTGGRCVPAGRTSTQSYYFILPRLAGFFSSLLSISSRDLSNNRNFRTRKERRFPRDPLSQWIQNTNLKLIEKKRNN